MVLFLIGLIYYIITWKKISLNRKRLSHIDSPECLKNKKATIIPKNNDNNWFLFALTVAFHCQSIKKHP